MPKHKNDELKRNDPVKIKRSLIANRSRGIERERLNSLINSMGDGVIAIRQDFKVDVYNGAALNILDSNTSMRGKRLNDLVHLVDNDNQEVSFEKLIVDSGNGGNYRDLSVIYKDGSRAHLYISISPVRIGFGKRGKGGYVLILRDITKEKSLEDERDEFISVVSHELRTPIAIAEGNVSNALFIANKTKDIKKVTEALGATHEQIEFLAGMINDLATLSRAERGKLVYEPETISIAELLDELKDSYSNEAKNLKLKLSVHCSNKSLSLLSAPLYVKEILQNFITNALKYTPSGFIRITAEKSMRGVKFMVEDSGIGMSKIDQDKIFDKFFRSEDYHTKKTKGTGLGLYVTMKLAKLLHANIDLRSEIGKGSTFTIDIPDLPAS